MTSPGVSLTDFLLARIAEDEAVARRAAFGYGAGWTNETDEGEDWSVVHADGQRDMVGCEDRDVTAHIARHDPARVLAECEAKRRIVAAELLREVGPASHYISAEVHAAITKRTTTQVLRLLALLYADHSDYDEAWRP